MDKSLVACENWPFALCMQLRTRWTAVIHRWDDELWQWSIQTNDTSWWWWRTLNLRLRYFDWRWLILFIICLEFSALNFCYSYLGICLIILGARHTYSYEPNAFLLLAVRLHCTGHFVRAENLLLHVTCCFKYAPYAHLDLFVRDSAHMFYLLLCKYPEVVAKLC